jgi:branched-subunit amino acid ABC-type transport system permease component
MTGLLPFLVVGVVSGSLYGLAGMGLVLTYKTSGIFNFAHGAVAAASAFGFYELHVVHGWPWPAALVIAVGGLGLIFGVVLEQLARRLAGARPTMTIVATVGLLLFLQGFLTWRFGAETRPFPAFLPTTRIRLAGVGVEYGQIITVVIVAAVAAGLYAFLRRSRLGVAMRGQLDDPALLALAGTSPRRVRRAAWIIGATLAGLTGVLIAPSLGLDAVLLTLLVVQAFGAAAVGAFASLPVTYAGGLVVGVASALATRAVAHTPRLSGLPPSMPFLVLFVVLVLMPRRRLAATGAAARRPTPERPPLPPALSRLGLAAGGIALLAVPSVVGARLPVYINGLTFVLIFLSLGLLVHLSGQISLCQAAFAAVGATTFSHLTHGLGLPWPVALVLAGLAVVPLGAFVAVPAIRLAGIYLALATFGLGVLLERVVFSTGFMFGGRGFRVAPRPDGLSSDRAYYYVVLAVVVVAAGLVVALTRSRLGSLLRALADSPVALATHGLSTNVTRVLVFCLSAFLAGVAGALFIAAPGQASGVGFGSFQSLLWLAVVTLAGTRLLASPFLAAGLLVVLPAYASGSFSPEYQSMAFGALAIAVAVLADGRLVRQPNFALRRSRWREAALPARRAVTPRRPPVPAEVRP